MSKELKNLVFGWFYKKCFFKQIQNNATIFQFVFLFSKRFFSNGLVRTGFKVSVDDRRQRRQLVLRRRRLGRQRRTAAVLSAPAVDRPQVRRHVVLPVELLGTDGAGVRLPVEVGGHIVPVEIGRVGVGVVADLASVGVALLGAIAPDADRVGSVIKAKPTALRRARGWGGGESRAYFGVGRQLEGGQVGRVGLTAAGCDGRREQGRHLAGGHQDRGRAGRGRIAKATLAVEAVGKSLFPELLHVQGISELGSGLGVLCRTVGVDHRDVVFVARDAVLLLEAQVFRLVAFRR